MIKYAIADDHEIFRQGLRFVLGDDPKLKCVGEAENGQELLDLIARQRPDVVLLDLKMPKMDGTDATKKIRSAYPATKILILTMYHEEHFILHLMELGANGYLLKNAEPKEIKKAIHAVYDTGKYFNDLVGTTFLNNLNHKKTVKPKFYDEVPLSEREIQVLKLICQELTNAEISKMLDLSTRTVEGYRKNLLEKLNAKNTAGLVIYALKNGIIS